MAHPVIVFALTVRVCGLSVNAACHHEHIANFTTEPFCQAAGTIMLMYPRVNGYRCVIDTREYQFRPGVGNPF